MYFMPYDENIIVASNATYLVSFSSCIIARTSTIMQQQFFPSERLVEFDLIGEDEYEIELFDPYVVSPPLSRTRVSFKSI